MKNRVINRLLVDGASVLVSCIYVVLCKLEVIVILVNNSAVLSQLTHIRIIAFNIYVTLNGSCVACHYKSQCFPNVAGSIIKEHFH